MIKQKIVTRYVSIALLICDDAGGFALQDGSGVANDHETDIPVGLRGTAFYNLRDTNGFDEVTLCQSMLLDFQQGTVCPNVSENVDAQMRIPVGVAVEEGVVELDRGSVMVDFRSQVARPTFEGTLWSLHLILLVGMLLFKCVGSVDLFLVLLLAFGTLIRVAIFCI